MSHNALCDNTYSDMVLKQVHVAIEVYAPICQTTLKQQFVNHSDKIVEATYHFPVPKSACVSDIIVSINDKVYTSQVAEKQQAQAQYEDGIESGKAAVLVQIQRDGVYEVMMGNIEPDARVDITLTTSHLMQTAVQGYQYIMPTLVAPKYSVDNTPSYNENKGLLHTITQHCFLVQYPFTATINNHLGTIREISHAISSETDNTVQLNGLLDKNIVFSISELPAHPYSLSVNSHNTSRSVLSIPNSIAVSSLEPDELSARASLCIVIDCSGSMLGSAIAQIRDGLTGLINQLPDDTELSVICFGSRTHHLTPSSIVLNSLNRASLITSINEIDVNMGGTNIFNALDEAQTLAAKHSIPPHIIVLTDGLVRDYDNHIQRISKRDGAYAIHCVGIGSGVSDDFILAMTSACQGRACFVHPNEDMTQMVWHFINSVSTPSIPIMWKEPENSFALLPTCISNQYPAVGMIQTNSHVDLSRSLQCSIAGNDGSFDELRLPSSLEGCINKLVGSHAIRALNKYHTQEAIALTIELGIITEQVSCVMVSDDVIEQADRLPHQVHIAQMVPDTSMAMHSAEQGELSYLDIPMFLRQRKANNNIDHDFPLQVSAPPNYTDMLINTNTKLNRRFNKTLPSMERLIEWGLPKNIVQWLKGIETEHNEKYVQACLAIVLLEINKAQLTLSDKAIQKLEHTIIAGLRFDIDTEIMRQQEVVELL